MNNGIIYWKDKFIHKPSIYEETYHLRVFVKLNEIVINFNQESYYLTLIQQKIRPILKKEFQDNSRDLFIVFDNEKCSLTRGGLGNGAGTNMYLVDITFFKIIRKSID